MNKFLIAAGAFAGVLAANAAVADDDTIKVGVLHSLSGTMAISETTLKDTVLMMIEEPMGVRSSLEPRSGFGGTPIMAHTLANHQFTRPTGRDWQVVWFIAIYSNLFR